MVGEAFDHLDLTAQKIMQALAAAVQQAEQLLAHTPLYYAALYSKGLALAGLALSESPQYVPAAIAAYRAARAINKDAGIVKSVLRLFDELAKADTQGLLAEVRTATAERINLPLGSSERPGGN